MIAVGVQTWGIDVGALDEYWAAADQLGYARLTYGDGLSRFTHDGWTMLGALAGRTRRVRVGPAVTYGFHPSTHHPSWLAKRAVTVDHLSRGRLDLRLGVGAEDPRTAAMWRSHGIAYPAARERIGRLEETVEIVRALWRGTSLTRQGRVAMSGARLEPGPVQRPGPPIWIAAVRPHALGLVARAADGWEASYVTPQTFAAMWTALERRLAERGRAARDLRRSVELDVVLCASPQQADRALEDFCAARGIARGHTVAESVLAGEGQAVAGRIREYAAAGVTDLMLGFADFPSTRMLEAFAAEVFPRLDGVG
jgi:alkanesulfonate monooxygenase SsuD/methylene tetrahydromethanopterin reductase-like flavin-dependent oxidoreductase (luciferase family)